MATSFSTSKKLLIIDPNPKSKINLSPSTAPPNSASSSSMTTAMPPQEKRTRDQPNFSDCHGCGRRINHTNPKDRLQLMDSVWRVVLLCRKCRKDVHFGKTCSYCFKETGNSGDLVQCNACERKIHKGCVKMYGNCWPWCYLGVGLGEFSVCVDCWVPELLKNWLRVCGKGENKGGVKDKGEGKDLLGNVKDGKMVAKAKEKQALSKAVVAKNALDLLEKNGEDSSCSGAVEVVDDAELAIQLHRAMNSSPRISRSKSLNSSALDLNGLFYKRSQLRKKHGEGHAMENKRMNQPLEDGSAFDVDGLTQRLLPYKRDKKRKIWLLNDEKSIGSYSRPSETAELEFKSHLNNHDLLETTFHVNGDQSNTRINVDSFGKELVMYKRTKRKLQLNGPCDNNNRVVIDSSDDAKNRTGQLLKFGAKAISPIRSCDVERDRYSLKYCRRLMGTKSDSNCIHSDAFLSDKKSSALALSNSETVYALKSDRELSLPNGTRNRDSDRYSVKYVRRVKGSKSDANSDTFLNQTGKSAAGLTMIFSAESSTLSDVSFDSFTTDSPK